MSDLESKHVRPVRYPSEFQKPFERISKKWAYRKINSSNLITGIALYKKAAHQNAEGQGREAVETEAKAEARLHHRMPNGTFKAYERSEKRLQERPSKKTTIFQRIGRLFS